jgi:ribosome-binding ATPase YchF (GTP1/OBG family)
MKLCLFGISDLPGLPLGKHNVKDPRLDEADRLVEAKKKTYVQIDLVGEDQLTDADAILVSRDHRPDLILRDLEFVETRLGRTPPPVEQSALERLKEALEAERAVAAVDLGEEERRALAVHAFLTSKPIVTAEAAEWDDPAALMLRAYREAGYISFLTVGGKENRAWPVRQGTTAWDAAGSIHSDIQKGFIRAEIISYADLVEHAGETGAKRAGKVRLETKGYVMQDYDVTNFRFNK